MTLSNNLTKNTRKVRMMMAEQQSEGGDSGTTMETSNSTTVDMDFLEEEPGWTYQPQNYSGSSQNSLNFGFQDGDNSNRLHVQIPGQAFFAPPPDPPAVGQLHGNPPPGPGSPGPAGSSPMEVIKGFLQSSFPFILLLLIKISFEHKTGIMLFLAMYGTFVHCNGKAVELMLPAKLRSKNDFYTGCFTIIIIVVISISLLFYTFAEQRLYRSLCLVLPNVQPVDLWGMLWIVGATDFVIKFATVVIKLLLALAPSRVLCGRKRGQWYQVVEVCSQFYRSVVPITPWIYFLLDRKDSDRGYWLSLFLLTAYVICKSLDLYKRLREVCSSLLSLIHGSVVGVTPNKSQMESIGSCCPICHDTFSEPIMLTCSHVFCEECITVWFDRERSCPMCRSKVQQAPRWRDGRTSASIQFF